LTSKSNFLCKFNLDELLQPWRIVKAIRASSIAHPALLNQDALVTVRTAEEVHTLPPGLTGRAQFNGLEDLAVTGADRVASDGEYLQRHFFCSTCGYLR
jgi:O-antigen biosynthesis protein WbqP